MPQLQEELVEPYHPAHVRGNGPEQDGIRRWWSCGGGFL